MDLSLRERLQADLPPALKQGDTARASVLRTTLAAIANAEAVDASNSGAVAAGLFGDVARRDLSERDIRRIVEGERDELRAWAGRLRPLGQRAKAEELAGKAEVLDAYL